MGLCDCELLSTASDLIAGMRELHYCAREVHYIVGGMCASSHGCVQRNPALCGERHFRHREAAEDHQRVGEQQRGVSIWCVTGRVGVW